MLATQHNIRATVEATLPSAAQRYREVRATTERLVAPLTDEDCVVQSMPEASPAKWHLAHTSWFFEEFVLQAFAPSFRPFDPAFRYLFNSYYDSVGERHSRPQRGLLSRPSLEQVRAYRAHIDAQMHSLLTGEPPTERLLEILILGLHHEQQHQELLLTDVKHLFSCNPLKPAYAPPGATSGTRVSAMPLSYLSHPGGLLEIGQGAGEFAFDNERPRHRVYLPPFRLANRAVTNGEFREFVRCGGYERAQHWLADAWTAIQLDQRRRPLYWSESLESEFTLAGMRELNPDAPICHVSYYEADAFARWAGARLPTEFEWEAVAAQSIRGNFLEEGYWHPQPARPGPHETLNACMQMYGDVWEWTSSAYAPYPGFKPLAGALGEYNGKFMVNQIVLRGGSCATPRSHMRPSYRNFFHPAARWQFSGLRLAADP